MQKQKILLVIDNLKKGGAEILLAGILPALNGRYAVILVTLTAESDFDGNSLPCEERYVLGFRNKLSLFSCIMKLKGIIRKSKPALIHAHLFYSSLVAKLACPSSIPLLYTLHSVMSKNAFDNSRILTFLERITNRKHYLVIAVSKGVLADYENIFGKQSHSVVLKNYIADVYFAESIKEKEFFSGKKIRLIAVGNIKKIKNYFYLLQAMEHLKNFDVTLDIYGQGSQKEMQALQTTIVKNSLPVQLKGPADNIHELLPHYDMYVTSSLHEGFGLAAVEAMALGLPLLLSDLPILREVTISNALFFNLADPSSFANLIIDIQQGKFDLSSLSRKGIEIAKNYTKAAYLNKLFSIYQNIILKRYIT